MNYRRKLTTRRHNYSAGNFSIAVRRRGILMNAADIAKTHRAWHSFACAPSALRFSAVAEENAMGRARAQRRLAL